jgi:serine/arginine repetitive matrix protein 2
MLFRRVFTRLLVPEIRMPVAEEEDSDEELEHELEVEVEPEYGEEVPFSADSSNSFSPEVYDDISPRASSSKSVFVESETTSPEVTQSYAPASPSSAAPLSLPPSVDGSVSPPLVATRSSIASRIQSISDRSPLTAEFSESEDRYLGADSPKRAETISTSTWEKVKSTFSRSGSTSGRRSRSNSIITRERRDHTDSSVSRESGASLTGSKTDKVEYMGTPGQAQAPPLMQSPSASTSILSLAPHAPPRGSVSPIPPPSSADMSKYQNSKLFPFPGMLRLEEERRAKGYPSADAFSPDVSLQAYAQGNIQSPSIGHSFSNTQTQTPELNKERKLSPKTSETHLDAKYAPDSATVSPSSPYYPEYLDISPSTLNEPSYNLKLPTTLPGVRQWLGKNSKKKPSSPAAGSVSFSPLPVVDSPTVPSTDKKPSLSDLFSKKANELNHEWEGVDQKQTSPAGNGVSTNGVNQADEPEGQVIDVQTFSVRHLGPLDLAAGRGSPFKFPPEMSPARFATPDPSSISDYPAATASESSSTSSSRYSLRDHQGSVVLERLEENLARGFKSPMWASAIDDPPRKLVLSSPVLQVVNPNTVKDRFLFLFNDILVITKPVAQDHDQLMDTYKLSLPDRKYAVKSVVQLRTLRFCADRSEVQTKTQSVGPRNPLMRSFISQFSKDPDHAIAFLFMKSNVEEDPALLGQLLFKTLELDRSRLGEYLSRKSSKAVLKSYLDSFGFAGLRVDVALRVFLHSINVSRHSQSYGALEYLLDSFAGRWYEANAKFVAYDKDMAIRLVWALAQLNDRLHGGIADEPGPTDHTKRNVTNREFQDAFRRYDARFLVSEEMLQELYRSVFRERLCQAYFRIMDVPHDTPITIKRPLPSRLTYKAQSDPIVFRLPQVDPLLTIELYGQDMTFDPPVLQFVRSAEASFRIMGTSLGSKTVTMYRSGPNAVKYSGLPLSHTIVIERAFMRNTFQLAFLNQTGVKRKYMFSVDDPIIRNEWATSLRRQIDSAKITASTLGGSASPVAPKFHRAAEAVAFKVLQDTLMGPSMSVGNHRTNGSHFIQASHNGTNPYLTGSTASFTSPHSRPKSRSKVYHRHGAGKNELDLGHRSPNDSQESNDSSPESSDKAHTPEDRFDGALWTTRDLEMQCQQNSSISLVLSFLQVAAPDSPS